MTVGMLETVLAALAAVPRAEGPAVLAIDGRCGAGKSTLAAELTRGLNCPVVHADDFFLRPEQRTPERYAEPGGNFDRERFAGEVLSKLKAGASFSYRPYDCRRQALGEPVLVPPSTVIIIEGSYSCHPELREYYSLTVFLTVSEREQLRRIAERCGPEGAERFRGLWIPLEEKYFAALGVRESCDLCFDTGADG